MGNSKNKIKNYELFSSYSISKDKNIRNEIFNTYQYLPELISKRYINKGIEYDDLYQIACIGLLYAIERFDMEKGYEFTSYATPTILGEIKKYFRDKGWFIRVPRKIQEIVKKINIANNELYKKLNRAPTVKELSEEIKYEEEEIIEAIEAGKMFISQSLNIICESGTDNKSVELIDIIKDETDNFEKFINNEFIKDSLGNLNKLERELIIDRFYNKLTQKQISKKLNISQMTVSRLEKKILHKLKIQYFQ